MRETADLFDQITGAWVGVIDLKGREQLLDSVVYTGPWAGRPSPASSGAGAQMVTTDVGPGRTWWWSDGTYWRPLNGRVLISNQFGTNAAPIATITGNGLGQTAALPVIPVIPANMLIPGAIIGNYSRAVKSGAVAGVSYLGPGVGPAQNPGGALAPILLGNSLPINANAVGQGAAFAQVLSTTVCQSPSYSGFAGAAAGYGEAAIDLTVPNYVNFQVNNSLVAGDSLAIVTFTTWLEF